MARASLRRLIGRLWSEERGSIVLIVGLAMAALIGCAALGTDIGLLFVERQRLSTIADAAALSGAQFLPDAPDQALVIARSVLQRNGVDPAAAQVSVSGDQRRVRVVADRVVPLTFARILGHDRRAVSSGAIALTANVSGFFGAAPLGVPRADWQIGQQVTLKMDAEEGIIAPGNYQALALGKSGASSYEQNLMYGYQDWIRAEEWVDTQTGNMAGPTVRAVNYRINQDPMATYLTYHRNSPRLVVVPILKDYNVNGQGRVQVVGFATFFLEAALDSGNNRGAVIGRFVRLIVEGEGSLTAPDFGARTTKLQQ